MNMAAVDALLTDAHAPESRFCQFSKTKMCKFHILKKCMKGSQCPFAHDQRQLRQLPDLRCTKICKTLIQTGQCNDPSCSYAHSKDELRSTGAFYKTKLCRFMETGHCSLGSRCNFAHSQLELRQSDMIPSFQPPPGLAWESTSGFLSDDIRDHSFVGNAASDKHDNTESPFEHTPAYVAINSEGDPWNRGSEDLYKDSHWSYDSGDGGAHLYRQELSESSDFGPSFLDWSEDWFGATLHDYANQPGSAHLGGDWHLFRDNVVIDQQEEWKAKASRSTNETPRMRSVRTSESTLCTLSDYVQA